MNPPSHNNILKNIFLPKNLSSRSYQKLKLRKEFFSQKELNGCIIISDDDESFNLGNVEIIYGDLSIGSKHLNNFYITNLKRIYKSLHLYHDILNLENIEFIGGGIIIHTFHCNLGFMTKKEYENILFKITNMKIFSNYSFIRINVNDVKTRNLLLNRFLNLSNNKYTIFEDTIFIYETSSYTIIGKGYIINNLNEIHYDSCMDSYHIQLDEEVFLKIVGLGFLSKYVNH